ncbi:hypothetical protein [Phytoactinopolyspora mesophila]|uniref:Uncharacterized protein n=1 Tax=Phytoactinopolyspora mesophila TaxID=2650750 RepID=A0A7K3M6T3_9ACTN|nr:hypothetical protein [Phytoactinopolyspora mesophila]NDL58965.1 hypothetical protein [Phytoactinopolyspora mesophila]
MNPTTTHPAESTTLRLEATASSGMLARLTAVLNPHPVIGFSFSESAEGVINVTVRVGRTESGAANWHVQRVAARLRRIVGVMTVEVEARSPSADSGAGVLVGS